MIAVEGYVDVISLSVAGFHHAVAPLGTALTEDQLALLFRLSDEPILCFDGDKAGRRAAFRAVDTALPNLVAGQVPALRPVAGGPGPGRSRPLRRRRPPIERVLAGARPLVDILWAREIEVGPLDTPERRAGLERRLRESLALIRDETLRRYYREDIESRISALNPDSAAESIPAPARRPAGGTAGARADHPQCPTERQPAPGAKHLVHGRGHGKPPGSGDPVRVPGPSRIAAESCGNPCGD